MGCRGHRRRVSSWCEAAARLDRPGPFQIQAAIAACHVSHDGETDWAEIAVLYDRLLDVTPSAVIELNRAVAVSMSEGPEAGLALLDGIAPDGELRDYHLLPAARGGHAAASGPPIGGGRGLPAGARPGGHRRRAPLPGATPARGDGRRTAGASV